MARLQVFKDGQKIKDIEVQPIKEWIIGRSDSCDLVLEGERGVSRQHLRLYFENGEWKVEVLSRFGELYQDGKKTPIIILQHENRFAVPPFDFVFLNPTQEASHDAEVQMASASDDFSDETFVGQVVLTPFLKVCNSQNNTEQVFRLEGHVWVAGRDTNCALFIDNQKFSRRHFEIRQEEGTFLVKDLGSSNGTLLNGDLLSTTEWTPLRSGDIITVVDWNLYFELRDAKYEERLQEVAPELKAPMVFTEVTPSPSAISLASVGHHQQPHYHQVPPMPEMAPVREKKSKLNWVHVVIILVVLGAGAYQYMQTQQSVPTEDKTKVAQNVSPFEKLNSKQQQYVKDTYRLADRLFKEGRYEMARQEVTKIHELIPYYEESKNLEKLAEVAIESQREQARLEEEERKRREMEEKIQTVLVQCQKIIDPEIEMAELDECLLPAIAFNPDHPGFATLRARVEQIIAERTEKAQKRAEYLALVKRHKSLFDKATGLYKEGKPLEAIVAFGKVVESKLPDPQNLKGESKRQIASIQKELSDKQSEFEKEADSALKKGDMKTAIGFFKKAIEVNPENEVIKGRMNSAYSELKKQMQVLYQEGVLEESVGEVETAKSKWKKILETSVPDEDYYKKAKIKMKKYGIDY